MRQYVWEAVRGGWQEADGMLGRLTGKLVVQMDMLGFLDSSNAFQLRHFLGHISEDDRMQHKFAADALNGVKVPCNFRGRLVIDLRRLW